jgi:hypothetical protein
VQVASDVANGGQLFLGPELSSGSYGGTFSIPIAMKAGSNYAVVARLKAGAAQNNFLQVAYATDSGAGDFPTNDQHLADRLQPIPGSFLSTLALPLGSVSITQQPTASPSSTVPANSKITLSIGVTSVTNTGSGPLVIQWQKNGTNIAGATGATYITPYLTTANSGSQYRAVVSMPGVSSNSSPVTVTVNADNVKPTVVSATPDDSMHTVTVQFSEPVDPVTGLDITKYSISGGVTVAAASYAVNANVVDNPPHDAVTLTTSLLADKTSYTVTVTGVKDTAANTIAGANTAKFVSYAFVPGFGKFAYFEDIGYNTGFQPNDDGTVLGFAGYSPKFINNDPDTIVYPRSLEMSPQGQNTFRSGSVGINGFPPGFFGTKMTAIITPTNTTNYVFYLATDDSGILWLSTDDNPTNKHAIAYGGYDASNTGQSRRWSTTNSTVDTNTLAAELATVPGVSFWPITDGSAVPIITLTNGRRYYLEVDQRETAGAGSVSTVTWDNGTGVAPGDGTATAFTGSAIGWHFPAPMINSIAQLGTNVVIAWTNSLSSISLGAYPYPGVVAPSPAAINGSFPSPTLLSSPTLRPAVWVPLTNGSPAAIPATNSAQFFKIGE